MRKIEKNLYNAFWSDDSSCTISIYNSIIKYDGHNNKKDLYLHGNLIASRRLGSGEVWFTLAGWNSKTTRSRLHSVCKVPVFKRNHVPKVRCERIGGAIDLEIETDKSYLYDTKVRLSVIAEGRVLQSF